MKKHDQNKSYSSESARMTTPVMRNNVPVQTNPNRPVNQEEARQTRQNNGKPRKPKKKKFHVYVAILFVWLIACTVAILYGYKKFEAFLVDYETAYQASLPDLVMDDIFVHFEQRNIEYLWANMSEHPTVSMFENEDTVKNFMLGMIEGKTLTYTESGEYTAENPCYAIEADGYVIGTVTLRRDINAKRDYGFPTWVLADISFPAQPFEGATITIPENSTVYVNGIQLDETYITEDIPPEESELQYVEPYGGTITGFTTYGISGLYEEPEIEVKDYTGAVQPVEYNEVTDLYSAGYSTNHAEREFLEEYGIEFTTLFANVISMDADLSELDPYFPPDSLTYNYISRNTALRYFTGHGAVTIENQEVRDFIAYNEDTVYMEVYIEQVMQMGWGDPEVVPTDSHLYLVRIDGEWQISGMKF